MTKIQAMQLVGMLTTFYPTARFSEENAQAYSALLMDLDFASTEAALLVLARREEFLPSIAKIRKEAQDEWSVRRPKPKLLPGPVEQPKVAPAYLEIRTSHAYLLPPPAPSKPEPVKYRHKLLTPEEQLAKLRAQEAQWSAESPAEAASEPGEGTNDG